MKVMPKKSLKKLDLKIQQATQWMEVFHLALIFRSLNKLKSNRMRLLMLMRKIRVKISTEV